MVLIVRVVCFTYLIILDIFITIGIAEDISVFICENGNEIPFDKTCDGIKHCSDGSDEFKKLCYHIICPATSFRCHYGACINKSSRCDGTKECADGSDEINCENTQNSCNRDEFKCTLLDQCIPLRALCDGTVDCENAADENSDICDDIFCPPNTFHCTYGGCIHFKHRCNGFRDCIDGSDESDTLCKSLNCSTAAVCDKIRDKISCPAITSTRIFAKCEVHAGRKKGLVPCNEAVPIGTVVQYECKPYYVPATIQHVNNTEMKCQADGTWSRTSLKCIPDCGRAEPDVSPLILNGWTVQAGVFPWHATLYALESGNWTFICGGSLVTERIVLTAAHCTWSLSKDLIKVALGKHKRDYFKRQDFTQIMSVSEIIQQPLYQDVVGNYGSDIAILVLEEIVEFSSTILPVCIDWHLDDISDHLTSNNIGLVLGMGLTENNTLSEQLRAVRIPVVSDDECIKQQKKDFKKYITFTAFCAGWKNGTGVCNGDSGGGLVFPSVTDENKWILQGIVSVSPRRVGTAHCDSDYYTVFTKVGMYVAWIHQVLQKVHPNMHKLINEKVVF